MNTFKHEARPDEGTPFLYPVRAYFETMINHTTVVPTNFGEHCPVCGGQIIGIRSSEYCISNTCLWSNK